MRRPSGRSSTVAPSRRSSVASAAIRSVSCSRMCATLRIVTGASANGAIAAKVGVRSETALRSSSTPRSRSGPVTVMPSVFSRTSQPMRCRISAQAMSPCAESAASPRTHTLPPVSAAAARK